jgi:hypothetical protein
MPLAVSVNVQTMSGRRSPSWTHTFRRTSGGYLPPQRRDSACLEGLVATGEPATPLVLGAPLCAAERRGRWLATILLASQTI